MRYARRLLAFLTLLLVASAFAALPGGWAIGPGYSIRFRGGKAEGTFSGLAGTVNFDPADPARPCWTCAWRLPPSARVTS